jgi:hypothetical protein
VSGCRTGWSEQDDDRCWFLSDLRCGWFPLGWECFCKIRRGTSFPARKGVVGGVGLVRAEEERTRKTTTARRESGRRRWGRDEHGVLCVYDGKVQVKLDEPVNSRPAIFDILASDPTR